MNRILLAFVCLVVACSQPSGAPSPTLDAMAEAVAAHVANAAGQALCGDEVCPDPGAVQAPPIKKVLDSRTPTQIAAAACRRSDGSWACKGVPMPLMASSGNATAAQCGPACTVGTWNVDWQNLTGCASDANSGTSATCGGAGIGPLLTFQQIISRLGSTIPTYPFGQGVTVVGLSAQTLNVDPIFFEPRLSGGAAAVLDMRSAWVTAGAAFAAGALSGGFGYAAATPSAGGTQLTIAGMPGYVTAGTLLNNTTRSSYAFADSAGGGTVQQPQTVASLTNTAVVPAPAVDNDWVAGDNIQPYTLPITNLKRWTPVGADLSAGAPTSGWVLGARIADTSGAVTSQYIFNSKSAVNVLSVCRVDTRLAVSIEGGRGSGAYLNGSTVAGLVVLGIGGFNEVFGGGFANGTNAYGEPLVANNAVIHGAVVVENPWMDITATGVFSDGAWLLEPNASLRVDGTFWGSYTVTILSGGTYVNNTGSTFALKALLTNGALKFGTNTTGSTYTGSGVWADGVSITAAHIDSGGAGGVGMWDLVTGAHFCNEQ